MEYCEGGSLVDIMKGLLLFLFLSFKQEKRRMEEGRDVGWISLFLSSFLSFPFALFSASGGPLTEKLISVALRGMLKGLDFLHAKNNIHRDIKAGNILVTKEGQIKLSNSISSLSFHLFFIFLCVLHRSSIHHFPPFSLLCVPGDFGVSAQLTDQFSKKKTFAGSPYWMAPEVIETQMEKSSVYGSPVSFSFFSFDHPICDLLLFLIVCFSHFSNNSPFPWIPGWYLVVGNHRHRVGRNASSPHKPPPHEGDVPHSDPKATQIAGSEEVVKAFSRFLERLPHKEPQQATTRFRIAQGWMAPYFYFGLFPWRIADVNKSVTFPTRHQCRRSTRLLPSMLPATSKTPLLPSLRRPSS